MLTLAFIVSFTAGASDPSIVFYPIGIDSNFYQDGERIRSGTPSAFSIIEHVLGHNSAMFSQKDRSIENEIQEFTISLSQLFPQSIGPNNERIKKGGHIEAYLMTVQTALGRILTAREVQALALELAKSLREPLYYDHSRFSEWIKTESERINGTIGAQKNLRVIPDSSVVAFLNILEREATACRAALLPKDENP